MNRDVKTIAQWVKAEWPGRAIPDRVAEAADRLLRAKQSRASRARVKTPRKVPRNMVKQAEREGAPARRRRVYAAVDVRSEGMCENREWDGTGALPATEHDHFFGRGKEREAAETVWHLCSACHHNKTHNRPSRADWIRRFRRHCETHGYAAEVAKCDRALALEAAQHPAKETP